MDLPGIDGGKQVSHVDRKLLLVVFPKLSVLRPADHAQQLQGKGNPASYFAVRGLHQAPAYLAGLKRSRAINDSSRT